VAQHRDSVGSAIRLPPPAAAKASENGDHTMKTAETRRRPMDIQSGPAANTSADRQVFTAPATSEANVATTLVPHRSESPPRSRATLVRRGQKLGGAQNQQSCREVADSKSRIGIARGGSRHRAMRAVKATRREPATIAHTDAGNRVPPRDRDAANKPEPPPDIALPNTDPTSPRRPRANDPRPRQGCRPPFEPASLPCADVGRREASNTSRAEIVNPGTTMRSHAVPTARRLSPHRIRSRRQPMPR